MSNPENPPETVLLTMSPLEGQQLFALLNERIESGDAQTNLSGLEGLLDMVSDANALALWLREYVVLEPDSREVALLREVLNKASPTKRVASGVDTVLSGIQGKLAKCQPLGRSPANTNLTIDVD